MSEAKYILNERKKILDFYDLYYGDSEVRHTWEEKQTIYYREAKKKRNKSVDAKLLDRQMRRVNDGMKKLRKKGLVSYVPESKRV